jgi:hypothetical protein
MGCYWHYCPICYPNDSAKEIGYDGEEKKQITGIERRLATEHRVNFLREKGYTVKTIRGCEFATFLKRNKNVHEELLAHPLVRRVRLEARDALKGGRYL